MNAQTSIHLRAPAKVNLALAVAPPNPQPPEGDGLHPISSWMTAIDLYDELTLTRLESDRASRYAILWHPDAARTSPIDWSITRDLAVRAHLLIEEELGRRLPVQMKLEKRIPVGAGLAGGSSDGAAALLAVRDLFELPLYNDDLRELAMRLGSDVAFFIPDDGEAAPGPAIVEGVGDRIERTIDVGGSEGSPSLILILPPFDCSTQRVYRAFDDATPEAFERDRVRELARAGVIHSESLFNDLASAAERIEPRLAEIRAAAGEIARAPVHITGSGSGMFIISDLDADADLIGELRRHNALQSCAILRAGVV